MSDPLALRETNPSGSWTIGDCPSSRDAVTVKPKHGDLCVEMAPGLGATEPISSNSSWRKRKSSPSETDTFGNEPDKVVPTSHTEGLHGQSLQREEQTAGLQPKATTPIVPLSLTVLNAKKRKLVLHIDLNNTILVSDAVTNQDPRAALNYYLSTVTWGKISPAGKTNDIAELDFCGWMKLCTISYILHALLPSWKKKALVFQGRDGP